MYSGYKYAITVIIDATPITKISFIVNASNELQTEFTKLTIARPILVGWVVTIFACVAFPFF